MAETQPPKSDKKRERQPISIPFIWEEKPGTPKRDWTPTARQIKPCPPPVKLVVSVPFGWEEKPGTPLRSFPSPPKHTGRDYISWSTSNENEGGDGLSDSESDTCSFKTGDSFVSAQSLSAVPAVAQSPGSPASETESVASSYATGTASLAGASFLEWLFPLLVPKSNFSNKVENDTSHIEDVDENESLHENNYSRVRKPLLTLEELIVMSRRRSCQRKVNRVRKQTSMVRGCFDFGSGNGIGRLNMKWKRQLQLKLM
ncbi:hypothetical protein PHJA_001983300 [Phtheirospermum japonicum]|uniref:Hydroxyproline-rich glycoprotein family protein n=1 Tax=Phtheirospermum japonicum TaxID=374723 RepID=A0A830CQK0_9LAMI|nr:hypothetical protein PHJA_001983300 [Phtheirospermum japonicum]